jgi:hypothetical protein
MISASGALNRRCFVVPSLQLVLTRLGDAPTAGKKFDRRFWELLAEAAPAQDTQEVSGPAELDYRFDGRISRPVLENLLFDLRGCTAVNCVQNGGEGGDVVYGSGMGWDAPLVFGFDFQIEGKPLSPTYEFYVKPDAQVRAPVTGTLTRLDLSQNGEDYSLQFSVPGADDFFVMVDHVQNPTLEVGESVNAGDILGIAGVWSELQGRSEIQINNDFDETAVCPFDLLNEAVKDDYANRLGNVYADFEAVRGEPDLYDEDTWMQPACLFVAMPNP